MGGKLWDLSRVVTPVSAGTQELSLDGELKTIGTKFKLPCKRTKNHFKMFKTSSIFNDSFQGFSFFMGRRKPPGSPASKPTLGATSRAPWKAPAHAEVAEGAAAGSAFVTSHGGAAMRAARAEGISRGPYGGSSAEPAAGRWWWWWWWWWRRGTCGGWGRRYTSCTWP